MKNKYFKLETVFWFLITSIFPIVCTFLIIYFFSKASPSSQFHALTLFIIALLSCLLSVILSALCFWAIHQSINSSFDKIKVWGNRLLHGDLENTFNFSKKNKLYEIAQCFNEISNKYTSTMQKNDNSLKDLHFKNMELSCLNSQLEDSNMELQNTLDKLNSVEEKYKRLIAHIPDIVCVFNPNGTITYINEIVFEVLGYSRCDLINKNIKTIIGRDLDNNYFSKIAKDLLSQSSMKVELPFIKTDLTCIVAEATFTNHMHDGKIVAIQAVIRDITAKKKMEDELIKTNDGLMTINNVTKSINSVLNTKELVNVIIDEIYRITKANLCILKISDYKSDKLKTKAICGDFLENIINSLEELPEITVNPNICGQIFIQNRPIITSDISTISFINNINNIKPNDQKLKQIMYVPLCLKNKNLGLVILGTTTEFDGKDLNILSYIANNSTVAIENSILYDTTKQYFLKTISALVAAIEAKDKYTEGHSQRVSVYATKLATHFGLSGSVLEDLSIAGILHDIGKIGIPDAILQKDGKLSYQEFQEIQKHPSISTKILSPVGLSKRTIDAIIYHHERYDGKGYPYGIGGKDLCIEAQIISIADTFDAMTSKRPYRNSLSHDEALSEIIRNSSTQFNPKLVDCFINLYKTDYSFINVAKDS